ncbi:site-specific DNA-methyltransferase [Pseudomonas aeruginosa]|uniref:DNA-methyltransferase n=1 Tax=Pseudomonas aeruginosa TaxID=287 RepID=UPI0018DF1668|nr:site-specific DNA-methyltransferase [Pseudomonas aeruginosa]MBH9457877.1 site-specific DNA-methyltransferase [Pseudomonas aeruginosa]MBH9466397.1 site-specific DNA-methyltransferase [Pseudomonas aeruginosa]QPZ61187.1 site-specific DNA-methyltransferase [Pseudomonas aeruginosa]HCL3822790.1 site-specific DNA-methyltransferase [Pseudomonas aeruginosa]HEK0943735.1 site-specific DNA-methyltransferase [Pseudomonas aeruginosa]
MELPYRLHLGDCLQVLKTFPDNSFDSVVTDPPYGLSFMGKRWDYDVPSVEIWAECLRVLKPGGHLLAFAGTRTQHRMALRIEDAGFEIRDMIAWVYGSGFPKSKNLDGDRQGWGTALKPALEPITVARKPLVGTVEANVLAHGTGAINIDACRIPADETLCAGAGGTNFAMKPGPRGGAAAGRWPANLIHDGSTEVVALFPADAGQAAPLATRNSDKTRNSYGAFAASPDAHFSPHDSGGSAARFFYCAKASRKDRNEGCEHMERKPLHWSSGSQNPGSFQSDGTDKTSQNNHPTVKPTDLMAYLVRLVTPPGGRVLDPFTGSGSTGKAAVREGFEFVGIEREPPYIAIAEARIAHELERVTAAALETAEAEAQLDIFRDAKEQIA